MSSPAELLERRTRLATIVAALACALFALNDVPVGIFQDDGHYLILARALAEGHGYRYVNLPGMPAATHFPPGFPLLLAPLWWIAPHFPQNVALFKLVNVALLPIAALGIRTMGRRLGGLSAPVASVLAIACVATVPVLFLNGLLFSETAFIAALCGVLLLVEEVVRDHGATVRPVALAGLAVGALALLRTVGLAVLPAAALALLFARRRRHAIWFTLAALVPLVPWQVWSAAHGHAVPDAVSGGYGAYLAWGIDAYRAGGGAFAAQVLRTNLDGLRIPLTLFGLMDAPMWAQALASVPLLTFLAIGLARLWRTAPVTVLTIVPYVALLLVWPFPPDRFLWPLWPVLALAIVLGVRRGVFHASRPVRRMAVTAAAALAALALAWHVRTWPTRNWERGERANARMGLAAAAAASTINRDELVASDMDAMVHLYASRPAVPLLALTAEQHVRRRADDAVAAQLAGVLDAYHPRWVLVTERESLRAAQVLARRGRLRLTAADSAGVLVYAVVQ